MRHHSRLLVFFVCLAVPWLAFAASSPQFRVPDGFHIQEIVSGLKSARFMAWGERGTLFVGSFRGGKVYAVRGALSPSPRVSVIAQKLKMPIGVAFRDGALFVSEPRRILRFDDIESRLSDPPAPVVAVDDLPYKGPRHAWKYIAFGPDDRLYVPVGSPCNVCEAPDFGMILSMQPDGSDRRVEARGIRNSVGFDWHPETGELWFTDNGRDLLGDEQPPDELNRIRAAGLDFGFPYCHGGDLPDPEFGKNDACAGTEPPVQKLAPHAAAVGMLFYDGDMFPSSYRNQLFIAEHGSWNRSEAAGKTGYRVSLVRLQEGRALSYEPFVEGFLDGQTVVGRPVGLLLAPDGSMLISDDQRGAIYRLSYVAGGSKQGD